MFPVPLLSTSTRVLPDSGVYNAERGSSANHRQGVPTHDTERGKLPLLPSFPLFADHEEAGFEHALLKAQNRCTAQECVNYRARPVRLPFPRFET
jgi:hypothetical protein